MLDLIIVIQDSMLTQVEPDFVKPHSILPDLSIIDDMSTSQNKILRYENTSPMVFIYSSGANKDPYVPMR